MTLINEVQVSDRFQRSIRIDTDLSDEKVISSFICPQSSAEVLLSMAQGHQRAGESAFTWTGPYGSGKSSLVIALSALLGGDIKLRNRAKTAIGDKYADRILTGFGVKGRAGWQIVPLVGHKGSFVESLTGALRSATGTRKKIDADNILKVVQELAEQEPCGLLLIVDELGKYLEGASEGATDIYIFQQLAELANRSNGKIVLLGILHQAFAEYARRLSREIRDEWAKIQGRYIDLPLNVAGEELIDLLGRAIRTNLKPSKTSEISKLVAQHIAERRPVHANSLAKALNECWPLHPVAAALLGPISRRRFGQNQRSVFGFLNSAEPYGFQDFLRSDGQDLYSPSLLWDYLRANLEPSIMASPDGHKWSLAADALYRTEAVSNDKITVELLKTIALIDLFQERSGVAPTLELLTVCFPDVKASELKKTLARLSDQSIIRFKKHKNAFALYEGSDFNIEAAAEEANDQAAALDFDRIRRAARFQPVVAKRHYHETGALRWLDVDLVPVEQALSVAEKYSPREGSIGLVMLVIGDEGDNSAQEKLCRKVSAQNKGHPVLVSLVNNSVSIRGYSKELQALEWVRNNNPSLGGDNVARREVDTRLADVKDKLEEQLSGALQAGTWYKDGKAGTQHSFKALQSLASDIAGEIYSQSPRVNSELVNRIRPSSNSMAALKDLLKAMATKQGIPRLGIEGYPAEGGLFETLLNETGLYQEIKGRFQFAIPENDECLIRPIWEAADNFFKENENRASSLGELFAVWSAPPIGLKTGLQPFFAMAYMLTRAQDYAIYRDGIYRPSIDDLLIDVMLKSPEDIALRRMSFSAIGQKILAGVAKSLNDIASPAQELTERSQPLEIARSLVSCVLDLAPWTLRTRQISGNAIKLRELIKNATDPNKVLFDDLPNLFSEHQAALTKGDVQPTIDELDSTLRELVAAYPNLLSSIKKQILQELELSPDTSDYNELIKRSKNIHQISGDFKLDAFSARLSAFKGSVSDIEGLASLAADKPARDWIDLDVSRVRLRLAELCQQFNNIEAFGRVQNREDYRHAVAFVVGLNGSPKTYSREFTIKKNELEAVRALEKEIGSLLAKKSVGSDLLLAALANLGARIVEENTVSEPKRARA